MNIFEEYHINYLEHKKLKHKLSELKQSIYDYGSQNSLISSEIFDLSEKGIDIKIFGDDSFSNDHKRLMLKYKTNINYYQYLKPNYSLELTEQILQILTSDKLSESMRESFINQLVMQS